MTAASLSNYQGLATGHAYSLLGAYEIKDASGNTVDYLVHMRNPWAKEGFIGKWSDGSPVWTEAYKAQVPYLKRNDGAFFMSTSDFIKGFYYFTITYYHDNWNVNFYEQLGFQVNKAYRYTFSVAKSQEVFAGADVYVDRMFPNACRGSVSGVVRLFKGSSRLS